MRILCHAIMDGYSSAHVDCIKRGSGWHLFRVLLASSNDRMSSSLPFETPQASKPSSVLCSLFSSVPLSCVFYDRALINAWFVWCQPSCMNLGAIFHPYSSFWTLLGF